MKGSKGFGGRGAGGPLDLNSIFDEIFEAARDFHDEFRKNFNAHGYGPGECPSGSQHSPWIFDENIDYYPNYSYPPMNAYMTNDRSLVFEFALAGFDEKDICLSFQGDYMVFSACMPSASMPEAADGQEPHSTEGIRYFKRRLKMKDIEKQKYYVPLDKYAHDKVKAVFRNGILRVSIPPKELQEKNDGIRIEIITED